MMGMQGPLVRFAGISAALVLAGCAGHESAWGNVSARNVPVRQVATVVTVRAQRGAVEETLETFGTVEFDPHETQTISFARSGQVAEVLVTPGQSIAKDEPLMQLGPLPSSSVEVEQARIDLEYAERNRERLRRLRRTHLTTNEAEQRAEKQVAAARAALEGLGIDGSGGPRVMGAPFSGVVVRVLVNSGSIVHPGEDAMVLAPQNGLVVRAGFEPGDALRLRAGLPARMSPVFAAPGERPAHAVLARLHRVVDARTQLVEALVRPERVVAWMVAGTKVRVSIVIRSAPNAVRVPLEGLIDRHGEIGVFVVDHGVARWQPIDVGIENGRWAEVRSGLDAGTVVVTTGRTSLEDGMAVAPAGGPES